MSGDRSQDSGGTCSDWYRKISVLDRVVEQDGGGFLFLIAGRVSNSASMIQMNYIPSRHEVLWRFVTVSNAQGVEPWQQAEAILRALG